MTTTPYTHADIYKSVYVGGMHSPGTVTLSDFPLEQRIEEQEAKGTVGSSTLCRGAKLSRFTATFYLADFEDCEAWDDFQTMLVASTLAPKPKALLAYHPDLVRNRILDVQVLSIGGMVHDDKGGATVVCKFIQYKPAKPKPAVKADAGKGIRQGTTTVNDPNAARKAELAALVAQARQP